MMKRANPYNTTKDGMTITQHNPTLAVELNEDHKNYGLQYQYLNEQKKWQFIKKLTEVEIQQAVYQRDKCIIFDGES